MKDLRQATYKGQCILAHSSVDLQAMTGKPYWISHLAWPGDVNKGMCARRKREGSWVKVGSYEQPFRGKLSSQGMPLMSSDLVTRVTPPATNSSSFHPLSAINLQCGI